MKKSEKIEVRLSYDEKTKLTDLATEQEQTISDLVRKLIKAHMSMLGRSTQAGGKALSWGTGLALLMGGVVLGMAGFAGMNSMKGDAPRFDMYAYAETLDGDMTKVSAPYTVTTDNRTNYVMNKNDGKKLHLQVDASDIGAGQTEVTFNFCEPTPSGCESVTQTALVTARGQQSSTGFKLNDVEYFVHLSPTTTQRYIAKRD